MNRNQSQKVEALKATKACLKKLLRALSEPESVESATRLSKNSFDDERLKKI